MARAGVCGLHLRGAFAQATIARLEELRLGALEERIEAELALGRHAELVAELARSRVSIRCASGSAAAQMLALYRSGRQAEALAAYQSARRALVDELGIEPGRALHELERRILVQDPALEFVPEASAAGGPRRSAAYAEAMQSHVVRHQRPRPDGTLLGRKRELDELCAGLDEAIAGAAGSCSCAASRASARAG